MYIQLYFVYTVLFYFVYAVLFYFVYKIVFNFVQSPGQYFLRPMMKEFSFEPASQMINVEEGSTNNVKIHGNRVAFR